MQIDNEVGHAALAYDIPRHVALQLLVQPIRFSPGDVRSGTAGGAFAVGDCSCLPGGGQSGGDLQPSEVSKSFSGALGGEDVHAVAVERKASAAAIATARSASAMRCRSSSIVSLCGGFVFAVSSGLRAAEERILR
jgi:hypothetical protein